MFLEAEVWTVARTDKGNAVLVRPINSDQAVPIFIGTLEAQNILLGMGEVEIPRPLTHDLLLSLLKELGAHLAHIEIHTLQEGTYFANLVIDRPEGRTVVDARPSDALALAVRVECPIYINEDLVQEAGISLKNIRTEEGAEGETPAEMTPSPELEQENPAKNRPTEREQLQQELDRLVAEENYEEAAKVRDKMRHLFTDFEE